MRIRQNMSALYAWRAFSSNTSQMETSIARLASGSRINSAADDAAGLSISERMRSQFEGMAQAARNARDGLSLVNTADATLDEVLKLLDRALELSVQASNGVYQTDQKRSIQTETDNILSEIDRIADDAQFNNIKLFASGFGSGAASAALTGLRTGWLSQAESTINRYYGLIGDNSQITIEFQQGAGVKPWIKGDADLAGKLKDITITLDPEALKNAKDADRIIARAMTQVALARNANYVNLSKWFISGASDFIAGGDEMLKQAAAAYSTSDLVNALSTTWVDDGLHQASAYLALKYLNFLATSWGMQISDPMSFLKFGADINTALLFSIGMDESSFIGFFQANGGAYLNWLSTSGALDDADVGGINPGDSAAVIPDGGSYSVNPTANFSIRWPPVAEGKKIQLQVGANANDYIRFSLPEIGRAALDLLGIDMVNKAAEAITRFQSALRTVTTARTQLGSVANTLEHTINANTEAELALRSSFSRIRDADYAKEVLNMTKQQILVQSSSGMLAKANRLRENAAWLLSGLKGGTVAAATT